jgi:hypothetical protein
MATIKEYERHVASSLTTRFGPSKNGAPFAWGRGPVPAWGREIPIPSNPAGAAFFEFGTDDAKRLAQLLSRLRNCPVLILGGGGQGARWAFLRRAKVVCESRLQRRIKIRSVRVECTPFPGEFSAGPNSFLVGSFRIVAIPKYSSSGIKDFATPKRRRPSGSIASRARRRRQPHRS